MNLSPTPDEGVTTMTSTTFDIMVSAFSEVTEIMRYHPVENFGSEITTIYAAISGNYDINAPSRKCADDDEDGGQPPTMRPEMTMFIDGRMCFLLNTVVRKIATYCQEEFKESFDGHVTGMRIGDFDVTFPLSLHTLQLAEGEVLRMCERALKNSTLNIDGYHNRSTSSIVTIERGDVSQHNIADVSGLWAALSISTTLFNRMSSRLSSDQRTGLSAKVALRNDNDFGSTVGLVTLGYMIAKLIRTIAITTGDGYYSSIGYLDPSKGYSTAVDIAYVKYSSLGSMSASSIISCFGYNELLPLAVINKDGKIGSVEGRLLLNTLTLSNLLDKPYK